MLWQPHARRWWLWTLQTFACDAAEVLLRAAILPLPFRGSTQGKADCAELAVRPQTPLLQTLPAAPTLLIWRTCSLRISRDSHCLGVSSCRRWQTYVTPRSSKSLPCYRAYSRLHYSVSMGSVAIRNSGANRAPAKNTAQPHLASYLRFSYISRNEISRVLSV